LLGRSSGGLLSKTQRHEKRNDDQKFGRIHNRRDYSRQSCHRIRARCWKLRQKFLQQKTGGASAQAVDIALSSL
jgi:hypothetical protein